MMIVG
jgi:hypothetical protein